MQTSTPGNASTNLRRTKSASSVKERRKNPLVDKPLDPETARVHALIAAHRALDRSHERCSTDLGRSDSNASCKTPNVRFSTAPVVQRQNSKRNGAQSHLMANLNQRSRSVQNSVSDDLSQFGASENYGAEPSSYRRLRKAKSFLTVRRASGSNDHTSLTSPPSLRHAASTIDISQPRLRVRLRKSFNFLTSQAVSPARSEPYHEEAVKLAREQFLNPSSPQVSSESQIGRIRRQQKPFRQTVRTHPIADTSAESGSLLSPLPTKRSMSASLRARFRKVFGWSSPKTLIPPQQLDAARPYHGEGATIVGTCASFDDYRVGHDSPSSRQSFYISTSPDHDPLEDLDKISDNLRPSSRDSLHSNGRSRVTSWTNSTRTGSTTLPGNADWNRLSIIKEDGSPHQPSSSAGRHIGGLSMVETLQSVQDSSNVSVDSRDVYSALIKRIGKEEDEMLETQNALQEIHKQAARDQFSHSTIRAVSTEKTPIPAPGEEHRQFSVGSNPWQDASSMSPDQQRENLERRRQKLVEQEAKSSFFPFSSTQKPETPSPFRKLLQQKQKSSVNLNQTVGRSNAAFSTDSVYSRTTHGGLNPRFDRSAESVQIKQDNQKSSPGMATILVSEPVLKARPSIMSIRLPSAERVEWKGWLENQMSGLKRTVSKAGNHVRESTEINEHSRPGQTPLPSDKVYLHCNPWDSAGQKSRSKNDENTPPASGLKRIQSRLLRKVSGNTLASFGGMLDSGLDRSSRKLSPANLGRILKERKSSLFASKESHNKENDTIEKGDSPPVSTPGRLCLQLKNGSGSGRLRKKQSIILGHQGLRNSREKPNKYIFDDESPTSMVKSTLSARLSRPFDMEVPGCNRPFDSTFLGRREGGFADPLIGDRLSVAKGVTTRSSYGYGGLGSPPNFSANAVVQECTALPQLDDLDLAKDKSGTWVSKRMVSNFLKSRRKDRSASEETTTTIPVENSPAFV